MNTAPTALRRPAPPSGERGAAKIIILVVLAAVVVVTLVFLPVKSYLAAFLDWTRGLGTWGPVFLAGFYVVASVFFLPGSVLTLGAGFLFGFWKGWVTVFIGANLGACAAFLLGRSIARDWVAKKVQGNRRFAAVDAAVGREGLKIVTLLRLSPVFPFNFLNYALGLTKVSLGSYVLGNLIGMIPGSVMYVYFGTAARDLTSVAAGQVEGGSGQRIFLWIGLAATVVVVTFVTRVARSALKAEEALAEESIPAKPMEPQPAPEIDLPVQVLPEDRHNQELVANVHPSQRTNPTPADRYNLVVIGAGTAGLVSAAGAAGIGAKVALIERHLLGGDCLNVGCVPSKALIRSSRVVHEIRQAAKYGVQVPDGVRVDFPAVMERVRSVRARISHHDSVQRFTDLGVDVFLGNGRFTGPNTVEVGGAVLRFHKAVIATGARPARPSIKGLAEAGFLTNETVFSITELPRRLAVIGGGPIGCEMAQAFQRLGSKVTLFHHGSHILDREDPDAAEIVQNQFVKDGVTLVLTSSISQIETRDGEKIVHFEAGGRSDNLAVDEILVGAGRVPNVEHLDLEKAGIRYDPRAGVLVDDHLQTSNSSVFAAGDICMKYKFTHAADAAARLVIQNALFFKTKKLSAQTIPWVTYTDPEIGHVGMYEREAQEKGIAIQTYIEYLDAVDRAVTDGQENGFVKIHVENGKDRILGATVVAAHAGEMIGEITLAMASATGLGTVASTIHPYPTQVEAIKHVADRYNRSRLTPTVKKLFDRWMAWHR